MKEGITILINVVDDFEATVSHLGSSDESVPAAEATFVDDEALFFAAITQAMLHKQLEKVLAVLCWVSICENRQDGSFDLLPRQMC